MTKLILRKYEFSCNFPSWPKLGKPCKTGLSTFQTIAVLANDVTRQPRERKYPDVVDKVGHINVREFSR